MTWLENVFPNPHSGGVVCIIDNLELLQSSEKARQTLEQLRDSVLNLPGIRWVLCGALGIVHEVVSSPRLEGILHKPIEIAGIDKEHAGKVFSSRIQAFKERDNYYLPLTEQEFLKLYDVLRGNLRSVLSSCDDYCNWVADTAIPDCKTISTVFDEWLIDQAHAADSATQSELRRKPLQVLHKAYEKELFSPGDYEDFGFNRIEALRPHIRDLESVGLLVSTQDEKDKRRKTIQVTPKGWLVKFFLDEEKKRQPSLI